MTVVEKCEHGVYGKGMCRDCRGEVLGEEDLVGLSEMRAHAAIVQASNCIHGERLESVCESCTRILNAIDPRLAIYDRATGTLVPRRNAQPTMPERPPFALSQGLDMHATVDKVVEDIKVEGARLTEEALKRAAHNADKTYPHGYASPIGSKHDAEKAPFHLLPWRVLGEVVQVLDFGRTKYAEWNWAKVPDARARYFAAAQRHLTAWWAGEANDPETGLSHLSHLLCCALFLRGLEIGDTGPKDV